MKYFVLIFCALMISGNNALAGNIEYGYNGRGDYVPLAIDGERVEYGYNGRGDYVPTSIGGKNINYGYNGRGDYVPTAVGDF